MRPRSPFVCLLLLLAISIPLFFLAAIIEGFLRDTLLSTAARLSIAALNAVLLAAGVAFLRRIGRSGVDRADWLVGLRGRVYAPEREV